MKSLTATATLLPSLALAHPGHADASQHVPFAVLAVVAVVAFVAWRAARNSA